MSATRSSSASKTRTPLIIVGVVVLVVVLAGVAVALSGGGDGDSTGSDPVPTFGSNAVQNQPVTISGTPLPSLDPTLATDPGVGMATPVLQGADPDGNPMTLGGPADNPRLFVFLAHWCPHCNNEIPQILKWHADGNVPANLDIVGISTAVEAGAPNYPPTKWLPSKGWLWPVLADDELASAFLVNGGSGFPYLMVVDADGTVLARASGEKPAAELAAWVDAALS